MSTYRSSSFDTFISAGFLAQFVKKFTLEVSEKPRELLNPVTFFIKFVRMKSNDKIK